MEKLSCKLIVMIILFLLVFGALQLSIYATNENLKIVEKSASEYIIYIKDNLNTDFMFAFSNDKNTKPENLTYIKSAKDSADSNANSIAYVDSSTIDLFKDDTYMWVKNNNKYILEGIKIDLSNSITEKELSSVDNITKKINVDLTQVEELEEIKDGVKYTTTLGKVIVLDEGDYAYQLVKVSDSQEYSNLMKLAEKVSKLNENVTFYDKLETYIDFYNLYNTLKNQLVSEEWINVENSEIMQPEEANEGDEYVLWLSAKSNNNGDVIDTQFLTCKKEMSQEKIVEKITTKLPVTYDNNIALYMLGALIVAVTVVGVRLATIKKD